MPVHSKVMSDKCSSIKEVTNDLFQVMSDKCSSIMEVTNDLFQVMSDKCSRDWEAKGCSISSCLLIFQEQLLLLCWAIFDAIVSSRQPQIFI